MKTHYELLAVPPSSSLKEIKKAYRKLALTYHPDKQKEQKNNMMVQLNIAFEVLSCPSLRERYDELLSSLGEFKPAAHNLSPITSFSESFANKLRQQHQQYVLEYKSTAFIKSPRSKRKIALFDTIKSKSIEAFFTNLPENFSVKACTLIINAFIKGNYWGKNLVRLKGYIASEIYKGKKNKISQANIAFYEAALQLFKFTEGEVNPELIKLAA